MIVYFLVKIVPKGIEKMTNKRSHLYHIKTNNPQHLHYRYWGLFFQCFRGVICILWTLYIHSPFLFGVKVLVIDVMHYLV
ncbi:hypothetical protein IMAU10237_02869 [Lactiplantibacillus plantarum]|nr:hypothetical protein [Lactiplantibacillus plantarum]MCG0899775.1 hypothetical protein [Lactiplantibacillus plantarum]